MSSLPGLTLESFLEWNYNVVVTNEQPDANPSLGMAEMLGTIKPRPRLTEAQFAKVVALFEPHREYVEMRLDDFDPESQSWRAYAGSSFDGIDEATYEAGRREIEAALSASGQADKDEEGKG